MLIKRVISSILSVFIISNILFTGSITSLADTSSNYDGFEEYSDNLHNVWITEKTDNVSVSETGYKGKAMLLTSMSLDSVSVQRTLETKMAADIFTIEAFVKGNGNVKLSFLDEAGTGIYVAGWAEDNVLKYSSSGKNRLSAVGDGCEFYNIDNRWNKIKIIVNKTTSTYKFVTGKGCTEKSFAAQIGIVCGVKFELASGIGKSFYIDEINIYEGEQKLLSAEADYVNGINSPFTGAAFLTEDEITDNGLALNCSTLNDDGSYAVKKDKGRVKIDLDTDTSISCDEFKNVFVDIRYKDIGYGWFYLTYTDTAGSSVVTESICLHNTNKELVKTFKINNVGIGVAEDGTDFEIVTHTVTADDNFRSAAYRDFSTYPVYLSSVTVYQDNTYSPVSVSVNTDNIGNIFFGREISEFDIELKNKTAEEITLNYEIVVGMYNRNMVSTTKQTKTEATTIAANGKKNISFSFKADEYGLYSITVRLFNAAGDINDSITVPFSKSVENVERNQAMGTNVHCARENDSDPEMVMELADKLGISSLRDSFYWYTCEREPGVYKLSTEQEAFLDAAIKYDMDILAVPLGNSGVKEYNKYMVDRLMTKEGAEKLGDFVYNLLTMPKFAQAVDRIEFWNEPDIFTVKTMPDAEFNAGNVPNSQNYQYRAKLYSDMLMEGYKGVERAEADTGKDYIMGAMSIQNLWFYGAGKRFTDCVLDYCQKSEDAADYNNGQYFDTISLHPYWEDDPEKGNEGVWYTNRLGGLAETTEGYRGLVTGGQEFKADGTDVWGPAVGEHTGNSYSFELSDGLWHTEFGYSTAICPTGTATGMKNTGTSSNPVYEGIQEDREWLQAQLLIRGIDCVRAMNFDDTVWFYDFVDDGQRDNEIEYNWGMLHNWKDDVPYAAKYSFLAASAYNKLTQGTTSAKLYDDYEKYGNNTDRARNKYLGSKLAFITQYTAPGRKVYMLRTTKAETQYIKPQDICSEFPTDVSKLNFYDMLGNKISSDSVVSNGRYKLTQTPYYVVSGEDISFGGETSIYVMSDGEYYSRIDIEDIDFSSIKAAVDFADNEPESYKLAVALYKDGILCDVKMKDKSSGRQISGLKQFSGFNFSENLNYDKIKIMLFTDLVDIKPVAQAFEAD